MGATAPFFGAGRRWRGNVPGAGRLGLPIRCWGPGLCSDDPWTDFPAVPGGPPLGCVEVDGFGLDEALPESLCHVGPLDLCIGLELDVSPERVEEEVGVFGHAERRVGGVGLVPVFDRWLL